MVNFPLRRNAADYPATDYQLVGLPGASDRTVKDFFAGRQNEDWEVVWDNGKASDFFVMEVPDSPKATHLHRMLATISITIMSPSLRRSKSLTLRH